MVAHDCVWVQLFGIASFGAYSGAADRGFDLEVWGDDRWTAECDVWERC